MTRSVQVISMRTWGELGNLLAGRTLAATLAAGLEKADVTVVEAETIFPQFAEAGAAIRELVAARLPADEVRAGYLRLMADFTGRLPADLDDDPVPAATAERLAPVVEHFTRTKPDLVIGTKGVISRLSHAALRVADLTAPVVNYVTNEGLLRLPVHRAPHLPVHLVQFDRARDYLIREHGYRPGRVVPVGRLLAQAQAAQVFEGAAGAVDSGDAVGALDPALTATSTRILILSNRGGREYLAALERIARAHPDAALVFVAYDNPALAAEAAELLIELKVPAWQTFDRLAQGDYLRYLSWLNAADAPLFISKTGPNSMLEGLYFGIPQLLVRSGLPMEEWVGPFLAEHGVGQGFDRMEELVEVAVRWVGDPDELPRRRSRAAALARTLLDPDRARRRTVAAVAAVLDGAPLPIDEKEGEPCSPE
ncbi:hypothetical protein ACFY2R_28370 [Micromonospora olivasterospora]|uniref:UDP-N-acetylglucosamine:LPS N-acetylglucosamine transferase n=1 Tax=Micromonospora olivasterospora TaxID=1880 RepID=A0A562IFT2_MICOL|nr:hypothetical protein [Micromonospora olivasterospora]TWH69752.1 UDP-N-acetylglucosamine:LPS N-acetylglucosamine transferase [Micromonospora olivasterospora]